MIGVIKMNESASSDILRYDISGLDSMSVLGLSDKFPNVRDDDNGNYSSYKLIGTAEELAEVLKYCKSKGAKPRKSKVTAKDIKWYEANAHKLSESVNDFDPEKFSNYLSFYDNADKAYMDLYRRGELPDNSRCNRSKGGIEVQGYLFTPITKLVKKNPPKHQYTGEWSYSKLNESTRMNEAQNQINLKNDDKKELLFKLQKLTTQASDARYQAEELQDYQECLDILAYLISDSKSTADYLKKLISSQSRSSKKLDESLSEESYSYNKQESYEYRTFSIPETKIKFSRTDYGLDPKIAKFAGTSWINSIHPYDDTNYHYAMSKDQTYWDIYLDGKKVSSRIYSPGSGEKIAKMLYQMDKTAGLIPNIINN